MPSDSHTYRTRADVQLDRLDVVNGRRPSTEALRLALSALDYIAETNTLESARTTASGALLGIAKELEGATVGE